MNPVKRIGKRSKKLREHKGLSQEELAALIDSEQSQISNFEAGRSGRISLESFLKLIALYTKDNYNTNELFNDKFELKKSGKKIKIGR